NEELIDNLLYFPDLSQIEDISTDDIYQLNDSTIIDMERLEIPRGFYQNAGSFSLNYSLNVDINESDDRHISYDVIPNQQFNITENSRGLTFQSTLSSQITDDLISSRRLDNREFPADYQWESNISTNHVTDKLTKAIISINPEVGSYNATLTGLYEQFMLNIFSNKTADIESFNYRLELSMTPSEEKIPEINELNKRTMSEFSYLMESVLTAENQRYDNDTQLLNEKRKNKVFKMAEYKLRELATKRIKQGGKLVKAKDFQNEDKAKHFIEGDVVILNDFDNQFLGKMLVGRQNKGVGWLITTYQDEYWNDSLVYYVLEEAFEEREA